MSETKASKNQAQKVLIKEIQLKCVQCGHDKFWKTNYLLNEKITTFLGWDALDDQADCYICEKCRNIMWFSNK